METPRSKQIRETNERVAKEGLQMRMRDRHERRHNNGNKTTLKERSEFIKLMARD
jgi:hypothetical protein